MNVEQARFNMIEQQIRPWDVLDPAVLELLAVVRREDFVPPEHRALAFVDMELPLRDGGAQGQSMLAPKVEARLLQELQLQRHEQVLEIGAGSGHMAALLAHRSRQVTSIEIVPELAAMATRNLKRADVLNARVVEGDGSQRLLAADGPFDAIVLSGSVAALPQPLLLQLKTGGRLIGIVGTPPVMRATLVTRVGPGDDAGQFRKVELFDTLAPALRGFASPPRFSF